MLSYIARKLVFVDITKMTYVSAWTIKRINKSQFQNIFLIRMRLLLKYDICLLLKGVTISAFK